MLDDEFPLSMFYEALEKKMTPGDRVHGGHHRSRLTPTRVQLFPFRLSVPVPPGTLSRNGNSCAG